MPSNLSLKTSVPLKTVEVLKAGRKTHIHNMVHAWLPSLSRIETATPSASHGSWSTRFLLSESTSLSRPYFSPLPPRPPIMSLGARLRQQAHQPHPPVRAAEEANEGWGAGGSSRRCSGTVISRLVGKLVHEPAIDAGGATGRCGGTAVLLVAGPIVSFSLCMRG